ncbi:MAG: hypothetical protein Q8P65_01240 [bacterium]|nr:hypothetical protein [bacterium]
MIERHPLTGEYVHFGTPLSDPRDYKLNVIPIIQSAKNSPLVGEIKHIEDLTPDERHGYDRKVRFLGRTAKAVFLLGSYWATKKINPNDLDSLKTISTLITPVIGLAGIYLTALGEYASSITKIPNKDFFFLRKG